jgi:HAD superfamily, subfamily IIIB (Acid phosphatase)
MRIAVLAAVAVLAAPAPAFADYESASGATFFGLRPTSLGLPQIGATTTIGAGELPTALRSYHDSGAYDRDVAATLTAARAYLDARLAPAAPSTAPPAQPTTPRCRYDYHRIKRKKGKPALYRRVRHCRARAAAVTKPAIVLDIDETSLSNYSGLVATNFAGAGTAGPAASGTGTALEPTLALYKAARARGVAVFFITGRPQEIAQVTADNLKRAGYDQGWDGLQFKPADQATAAYKAGARAAIERDGYTIVLNLGDQESDLDGGHAERAFKLPNPFYFIPD